MCPIPHSSAYRPESKLLETDGDQRIMLKMGPYMPETTVEYPILSRNVPLGTGTYCTPE